MQQFLVWVIALFLLVQGCTQAYPERPMNSASDSSPPQSKTIQVASPSSAATEFSLRAQQWQYRVVLLFAPSEQTPAYQQQMQEWQSAAEETRDRDLKLVEVIADGQSRADGQPIATASAEQLRSQFGVAAADCVVILIGKDGTEKRREQAPIDPAVLFRTIDAMPMRQQEMKTRQ
jgi:hypothetical protein